MTNSKSTSKPTPAKRQSEIKSLEDFLRFHLPQRTLEALMEIQAIYPTLDFFDYSSGEKYAHMTLLHDLQSMFRGIAQSSQQ